MPPRTPTEHQRLFELRLAIARLGESDAFGWWHSYALTDTGAYAVPRIFRRAPALAAAHLSLLAARARHGQGLPKEPVIHLFDFGEEIEGSFERWLIEQKSEARAVDIPPRPTASSVAAALDSLDIETLEVEADSDRVLLDTVTPATLANATARIRTAARLAGAYTASVRGRLVIPYCRLAR